MGSEETLLAIDAEAVEASRAETLSEAHLQLIVETFQALADPTRARILYALTLHPLCVRDLAILVGVSGRASRISFAFYGTAVWSNHDAKETLSITLSMITMWLLSSKRLITMSIM